MELSKNSSEKFLKDSCKILNPDTSVQFNIQEWLDNIVTSLQRCNFITHYNNISISIFHNVSAYYSSVE